MALSVILQFNTMLKIKNINKLIGTKLCDKWEIVNIQANYSEYIFEVETGGVTMYNPITFVPTKRGAKRETIKLSKGSVTGAVNKYKLDSSFTGIFCYEITTEEIKTMDRFITQLNRFIRFCDQSPSAYKSASIST